jgi:hypothetical protein
MDQSADSTIGKRTDGIGDMEQASVPLTVDYLDIETGPEITYGPLNNINGKVLVVLTCV